MKNLFRSLLAATLFLLTTQTSTATHLLGGEVTWECLSNGKYIFTLTLYKECGGSAAGLGPNQTISGPVSIPVSQTSVKDISPVCLGGGSIGCGNSPSGVGAVERYVYKSSQITLPGTPPAGGWTFYWNSCCRPGTVVNGPTSSYYLRAIMYPYTPVGGNPNQPLNANPCFDSSPYFSEQGSLSICSGSEFTYNHLASDKDLDSLYIRFADPWVGLNQAANFAPGYSSSSPYPSNLTDPANGPITIDHQTGAVSMNIQNATPGSYASCYAIEAWKCGQTASGVAPIKVAEVFRDVAIVVKNNCVTNNEPSVLIDTTLYPDITKVNDKSYYINVYPGDTIDFQLSASDFDYLPIGMPQSISFSASGLQVSDPMPSGTGCTGVAPCAQVSPVTPQTGFTSPLNNNVRFFWVPSCQHLGAFAGGSAGGGNYCNPVSSFYFSLRMQDNGCPAPEIALTTFVVNVVIGDPTPVGFGCLTPETNGDVSLGWERSQQDSALKFNYYMIMGATPGGTFDTIARVYDIDSTGVTLPNANGYTSFYMLKSTGDCDFMSRPSDTLEIMNMSLTATPPGSSEYAQLSWTPLRQSLPWTTRGVYEVWSEAPAGSGNWKMVAETPSLSYTDTVTVCDAVVNYQIRVTDTIAGCQSGSNIDSARFSDQTNSDKMVLDSVSVNADGNAIVSWKPTNYGDVVEYYIYFNDPKLGWIVVDTVSRSVTMPYEWGGSSADSRSEQFKVVSVDSCGNQSDDQVVKPHQSIYLRNYLNKCEGYSRISWNQYEGFGKGAISGYRLLVQTTDDNGSVSPYSVLFTAAPEDTSYLQNNLRNGYQYCYKVQAVDSTGTLSSTSNEICIQAEVPKKSKILYLAQATFEPDGNAINLSTFVDGEADVQNFTIERAPDIEGPYQVLGTVGKPSTKPYLINFSDYGADGTEYRYYYRVSATDSCGGRDTISNYARNILLNVEARANLTNLLTWNEYFEWDGEVNTYSIYRQATEETQFYKVAEIAGTDTFFVDDISDYGNTDGGFCYYVLAQEGPNSLNVLAPNGLPYTSRSNDVCMHQWARVYMPTAFRPGSDIGVNRSFGPTVKFEDVGEYSFYIMNRWGVKVFETSDPSVKWDGLNDGEEAAPGVYVYFLKYATTGDKAREQRGTFTLIR